MPVRQLIGLPALFSIFLEFVGSGSSFPGPQAMSGRRNCTN